VPIVPLLIALAVIGLLVALLIWASS